MISQYEALPTLSEPEPVFSIDEEVLPLHKIFIHSIKMLFFLQLCNSDTKVARKTSPCEQPTFALKKNQLHTRLNSDQWTIIDECITQMWPLLAFAVICFAFEYSMHHS